MPKVSPQTQNGYVKIANELFEAIIERMPFRVSAPVKIFYAVMRQTYGYNRKTARITTDKFRKLTGINDRRLIHRAKKQAIDGNMINVITNDDGISPSYSINKNYLDWENVITTDDSKKRHHYRRRASSLQMTPVITTDDGHVYKDNIKDNIKTREGPRSFPDKKKKTKKTKKRIPNDFDLTEKRIQFAEEKGINGNRVRNVFDHFRDHHKAKGSTFADWDAAWRNWVRKEIEFNSQEDVYEKWINQHS